MAVDARDVAALVEDEEMAAAVESVLDAADDGTLQWDDVDGDVTSGQWGRLIQAGVVSPADGDDFALGDRDVIERALDGDIEPDDDASADDADGSEEGGTDDDVPAAEEYDLTFEDIPDVDAGVSWTQWDKVAAGGAVSFMVGYWFDSVRRTVGGVVDLFVGPLHDVLPFWGVVLLLATLTGTYASLLMANLMDTDAMSQYQERMKAMQEKQEEVQEIGDEDLEQEFRERQMEMMGEQLGMFKLQFRPMVWIMLLTIPIFLWLRWQVGDAVDGQGMIMPIVGAIEWDQGVGGPLRAWIAWYMLVTISFRQLITKALHVQTSPTGS